MPTLVYQRDGYPVDLELRRQVTWVTPELPLGTRIPRAELILGITVVQRQHGVSMNNLLETSQRTAPDALGRRVGARQLGVLFLQLFELGEDLIVVKIRDLRIGDNIVEVVVTANQPAQLFDATPNTHRRLRRRGRRRRVALGEASS